MATAKAFVREGAYVFITRRRQKELDEAVKAIGANVSGVQGDISKLIGVRHITPHPWIRSRVIKPSISIRMGGTQHQGRP